MTELLQVWRERWRRRREARRREDEARVLAGFRRRYVTYGAYELSRGQRIRAGRLYPTLRRLEERGLIRGEFAESGRRLYVLTDEGFTLRKIEVLP